MAEKDRNLVERYSGEEKLHGEGIAEAVRVAACDLREIEQLTERALPVGHGRLR